MSASTVDEALSMFCPAAEVMDRLAQLEAEARLLRKLLPLAIDADEARARLREPGKTAVAQRAR